MPRKPHFDNDPDGDGISIAGLNAMADQAWKGTEIEGGEIEEQSDKRIIRIPTNPLRIKARVWLVVVSDASGSADSSDRCVTKRHYAFAEQINAPCGEYVDKDPFGITGNGDEVVAYEDNNTLVRDNSIQTLEQHTRWRDTDVTPSEWVTEWHFAAAAGTDLASGMDSEDGSTGSGSDGSSDCESSGGIPLKVCDADGNSVDACLKIVNAAGDVSGNTFPVIYDSDGNVLFGGP